MDLTKLIARAGVGGTIGTFVGYNAGPIVNEVYGIGEKIAGNVTSLCVAAGLVAGGLLGHWMSKRGLALEEDPVNPEQPQEVKP